MPTSPRIEDTPAIVPDVPPTLSSTPLAPSQADVVFSEGDDAATIKKLIVFFAVAYFAQGVGQHVGFVSQPLTNYLKSLGLDASQVTNATAALIIPWSIKPVYGLITDLFPLWGLRRRSYLFLMTALAMCAYVAMAFAPGQSTIIAALFVVSFGVAFGDVLVDAITVENGQRTGMLRRFQSVQWLWVSVAGILAAVVGGQLAERLDPRTAVTIAALLPLPFFAAMLVTAARSVQEEPTALNRDEVLRSTRSLLSALKDKTLLKVTVILGLMSFVPSAGASFYFHLTETLKISQQNIGYAGAIGSAGAVVGALLFNKFFTGSRFSPRVLLGVSVIVSGLATLLALLIRDPLTLFVVSGVSGVIGVMVRLTVFGIAGDVCPKRAEGFTFALLMGVLNLATQGSAMVGSQIFVRLGNKFAPLIVISALMTLATLILVPLLPYTTAKRNADTE